MKQEEMTLQQFQRRFPTEKACMEHLFKLRWPEGYRCPKCGHSRYSFHSTRKLYQCGECRYQVSVTAGTIFHKTRTPLVHWFWMIFIMTRQKSGASMLSLQGMLGVKSYKTVWTMSHKIRRAMAHRESHNRLTGLVETLQAFLGRVKPGSKGKDTYDRPNIVVRVEDRGDSAGLASMTHISRIAGDAPVEAQVTKGADSGNEEREAGCELPCKDPDEELTPLFISDRKPGRIRWARILMANLTGNLRGVHHGVSKKHLHRYLSEFLYRFNRRARGAELINRALLACVSVPTITYEELKI